MKEREFTGSEALELDSPGLVVDTSGFQLSVFAGISPLTCCFCPF